MTEVVMEPRDVEDMRRYAPSSTKLLRACMRCRLIMTKEQFFALGCPTCEFLEMKESEGRVVMCTTPNFSGFISMFRPGTFVCRFSGLEGRRPGCYALTVQGAIPEHILHESEIERDRREREDKKRPGIAGERVSSRGSISGGASASDDEALDAFGLKDGSTSETESAQKKVSSSEDEGPLSNMKRPRTNPPTPVAGSESSEKRDSRDSPSVDREAGRESSEKRDSPTPILPAEDEGSPAAKRPQTQVDGESTPERKPTSEKAGSEKRDSPRSELVEELNILLPEEDDLEF